MDEVKNKLKTKWDINPCNFWIPLSGEPKDNVFYFNRKEIETSIGFEKLNKIVNEYINGDIYSFCETREENILNQISFNEFFFLDTFYTNKNSDWVIYITHEGTITFAGDELCEKIKTVWTEWETLVNPWDK